MKKETMIVIAGIALVALVLWQKKQAGATVTNLTGNPQAMQSLDVLNNQAMYGI